MDDISMGRAGALMLGTSPRNGKRGTVGEGATTPIPYIVIKATVPSADIPAVTVGAVGEGSSGFAAASAVGPK
jgi:hypothetical protein